jgi:hypothetical protein
MKNTTRLILVATLLALLYLGYTLLQGNTIKLAKEQQTIDSLTIQIAKLDSQHVKKDSVITVYKDSIVYVDKAIETVKTKYIHIKHKYDEIRTHVSHYTPTQLDSFFSERYRYVEIDTITQNR